MQIRHCAGRRYDVINAAADSAADYDVDASM